MPWVAEGRRPTVNAPGRSTNFGYPGPIPQAVGLGRGRGGPGRARLRPAAFRSRAGTSGGCSYLRLWHSRRRVPPLVGRRGRTAGHLSLVRSRAPGADRRSSRVRHRGSAGLGRRPVVRPCRGRGHSGDAKGGRQRHRGQPAPCRSGVVAGYPDLLAEATAVPRPARVYAPRADDARRGDPRNLPDLLHQPGAHHPGRRADRHVPLLPLGDLDA